MKLKNKKYLILRRAIQLIILILFAGGNYFGWNILIGNYSSATFVGVIQLSDPYATLQILASGFLVGADVLIGAATIFVIYTLIGGRVFCSWVCPVNMLSDFSLWLREVLRKRFKIEDNFFLKVNKNTRYYILGLSFVLSAILGYAAFEMISPISIFHRAIIFGIGSAWAIILAFFIFELSILKNGWCGHLCPLGAFYSITGKYGLLKVYHTEENCTACNKCFPVCPEKQVLDIVNVKSGYISSGECTNCGRCIDVCQDDALKFSLNYKKNTN